MKKLLPIFLLALPLLAHAQEPKELLRLYFNEVRAGKYPPIPAQFGLEENATKTLAGVGIFEKDTTANVRSKAYSIVRYVGTRSRSQSVREKAVENLVQNIQDKDVANVGTVLSYLTEFKTQDFTQASLNNIRARFSEKPPHFDQMMRLVGFLKLSDLKESIRPYMQPGNSKSERWSAIIALARMGDMEALSNMMTRVKKLPVNDDVVMEVFPDVIYTRQKDALDYLIEVLNSDDKNCLSPGEDERPIVCGYRVMEQLAPVVEGYPLEVDESGDVKTSNYRDALATVRAWFEEHKNYKVDENGY